MPFWAGDLTEEKLAYPLLEEVVRQAAWDLFFRAFLYLRSRDGSSDPPIRLVTAIDQLRRDDRVTLA